MDGIMQLLWQVSWQTAIFAVVVWTVTRLARKAPASWKHVLWLIVLVKFFVPPFAQFPAQWAFWQTQTRTPMVTTAASPVANPITPNASPSAAPFVPTSAVFENSPTVPPSTPTASVDWHGLIPPMWIAGIALMSIILILRYRRLSALAHDSRPASKEWAGMLADAGKHLGIRRLPEIRLADRVSTPMLSGLFRPIILMPSDIGRSCCSSDLLAILFHEVAHVKRLDMAVAWLQQLVQVFFFFHPAVWLAGREIRRERELACDELVLSFSGIAREDYAAGYMSALKLANGKPTGYAALAMAEPFDFEKRRLNMILHSAIPKMTGRWVAAMVVLAAVGLPGCSGIRQSQDSQLQIVLQGSKQADASLSCGKGRLTARQLYDKDKKGRVVKEFSTEYHQSKIFVGKLANAIEAHAGKPYTVSNTTYNGSPQTITGKAKLLAETVSVTSLKEQDEKTLTEMLRDGVLSEHETGQVTRILGGGAYYGLVVRYREASRHPELFFAKPEIVIDLAERLKPSPHSHLATISLWAEPSASVLTSSQALARKVVRAFHADLMAARDNYLELVEMEPKFHDDSDRFSCSTQWQPPAGQDLHSKLRLRFLSVGLPYLGNTQSDPQRVIFPLQKVSVDCYFNIKDDKLGIFVRETIDRNIQPLIKAEKVLGGKPYFENWDIDYRR